MTNTELTLNQLQAISGGSKYINDAGTQGSMKYINFDSTRKTNTSLCREPEPEPDYFSKKADALRSDNRF